MNAITAMFSHVKHPLWIKDNNEIVFMNDVFIDRFNAKDIHKSKVDKLFSIIKKIDNNETEIISWEGKIYNHISFEISTSSEVKVEMLVEISQSILSPNMHYAKNILRNVMDNISELIFYKDKDLRYVGNNMEFNKFYNKMGIDSVIGKRDEDLPIDKSFIDKYKEEDMKVMETKLPVYIEETVEGHTFETVKTPIISEDGSVEGIVGVVRDITASKWKEDVLKQLCYTDALTNLYNRTYFDEKIEEYINSESYPIGLILGDVNGLKIVNDTLGHIEGDRLLQKMANLLKEACGDKGTVFRWGGDAFITLLPNCSDFQCTKLMNDIDELCSKVEWGNINLTISQGFAILEKEGSVDKVLGEAENKVYNQKVLSGKTVRASMLETLKINLENKNVETELHTDRVSNYCVEMAKALNLDDDSIEKAAMVGKLHDIGKIGIPDYILLKPARLTNEEYEIMKTHSEKGYRLASLIPEISTVSKEILTHHERWDGKGYPLGLKKYEIPILARIVTIVDSFDAMTEDRCYSKGRSMDDAIKELRACSGTQFDPELVEVFISLINKK